MGTVYEGWDPVIDRRVAIKTVRLPASADDEDAQEELARFKREAQAAGRLHHPNIVGVFDYGETDDLAYIVMEFVDGRSLKAAARRQRAACRCAETVRVMDDVLAGLQYSHERGVVHRDIKPANIMLTSDGPGEDRRFRHRPDREQQHDAGRHGDGHARPTCRPSSSWARRWTARTDIYSCGVLLYQLLTGERPFEGSMTAIMHKALNTEPPAALGAGGDRAGRSWTRWWRAPWPGGRRTASETAAAFAAALRTAAKAPRRQARAASRPVASDETIWRPAARPVRRRARPVPSPRIRQRVGAEAGQDRRPECRSWPEPASAWWPWPGSLAWLCCRRPASRAPRLPGRQADRQVAPLRRDAGAARHQAQRHPASRTRPVAQPPSRAAARPRSAQSPVAPGGRAGPRNGLARGAGERSGNRSPTARSCPAADLTVVPVAWSSHPARHAGTLPPPPRPPPAQAARASPA